MTKKMKRSNYIVSLGLLLICGAASAQQVLTLDDCRRMAVQSSRDLEQAQTAVEMAGYDRKVALANYFPNISATGTYQYNNRDIALVSDSDEGLDMLSDMGRFGSYVFKKLMPDDSAIQSDDKESGSAIEQADAGED